LFFPRTMQVGGGFPFPGGWLLGALLLVNLLAAHITRFRVSWKRSGILLLHAGLVVMMLSEAVTGAFAVEGKMTLEEGRSANYVEHHRFAELAVVDTSDPRTDDVVVVPGSLLQRGGRVSNELLPFDVEVVRYMVNSALLKGARPGADNPATKGVGLERGVA